MTAWARDHRRERIEDLTDLAIAIACALGIVIALGSLFYESRDVGVRGEAASDPIGRVTVALAQVRRRAANSLVWRDVSTGARVYDGDTMFVPPLAYARVTLDDGSELVLDPESLTVVEKRGAAAGLRVQVARGTVSGRSARPGAVTVRAGTVEAALGEGAVARLSVLGDEVEVDLLSGAGEVATGKGTMTLTPATGLRVDASGATTVSYPVELTSPRADARIDRAAAQRGVELTWSGRLDGGELWLSNDRSFREVTKRTAAKGSVTLSLARPGRYYWKVVGADGRDVSPVARFWVVPPEPPQLLSPASDFAVRTGREGGVRLEWSPVNGATRYRVEVVDVSDRDLDERRDLLTLPEPWVRAWSQETSQERAYVPSSLAPGKYRWRVVPLGSESGRPSAHRSLRITETEVLQAPEVLDSSVVVE